MHDSVTLAEAGYFITFSFVSQQRGRMSEEHIYMQHIKKATPQKYKYLQNTWVPVKNFRIYSSKYSSRWVFDLEMIIF